MSHHQFVKKSARPRRKAVGQGMMKFGWFCIGFISIGRMTATRMAVLTARSP